MVTRYHLAEVNIARMRAPLEDPLMEGFRSQLDTINALADRSPGFVWRLQTDEGNATALRPYDDDRILVNMSVWTSLTALSDFVYRSRHVGPLRDREKWFHRIEGPILVLWWIPAGHLPTVEEGKKQLAFLKAHGPTPDAFTFRDAFPPPGQPAGILPKVDAEFCDWAR